MFGIRKRVKKLEDLLNFLDEEQVGIVSDLETQDEKIEKLERKIRTKVTKTKEKK